VEFTIVFFLFGWRGKERDTRVSSRLEYSVQNNREGIENPRDVLTTLKLGQQARGDVF